MKPSPGEIVWYYPKLFSGGIQAVVAYVDPMTGRLCLWAADNKLYFAGLDDGTLGASRFWRYSRFEDSNKRDYSK